MKTTGNVFDVFNDMIRGTEGSIVNLLTAIAPWLAPIAPAAMSWNHMVVLLQFDQLIAWAIAFVVEVMGMASVSTIISFWSHNRNYKDDKLKAPTWMALATFVFYLGVVIVLNVVLDAAGMMDTGTYQAYALIAARAVLTLLTVPAAVLLAIRTQHNQLLNEMENKRQERKQANHRLAPVSTPAQLSAIKDRREQFHRDVQSGKLREALSARGFDFDGPAIAELYNVSERTGWRWKKDVEENNGS